MQTGVRLPHRVPTLPLTLTHPNTPHDLDPVPTHPNTSHGLDPVPIHPNTSHDLDPVPAQLKHDLDPVLTFFYPPLPPRNPFDIAMWKTLTSVPYAWHLFQAFSDRFCASRFIRNYGYHVDDAVDGEASRRDPSVYLLHGSAASSGARQLAVKFPVNGTAPQGALTARGGEGGGGGGADGLPSPYTDLAALRISVFLRTHLAGFDSVRPVLASVLAHFPAAAEVVVAVPPSDVGAARAAFPPHVRVVAEHVPPAVLPGALQHLHTVLYADLYCSGEYVYHLGGDAVLLRPVLLRDLFLLGKPMAFHSRYVSSDNAWRRGVSRALGRPIDLDFSRTDDHLYPRFGYAAARGHLAAAHNGSSVSDYLAALGGEGGGGDGATSLFSEFNLLAAALYAHHPSAMAWVYAGMDSSSSSVHAVPYAFAVIRPRLHCAAESWRFEGAAPGRSELREQARQHLRDVVAGNATCAQFHAFLEGVP